MGLTMGIWMAAVSSAAHPADADALVFRETFAKLEAWRDWTFEKIERSSQYSTVEVSGRDVLSAKAEQSASGLILGQAFKTEDGLSLRWRWRVLQAPDGESPLQRAGDDFALRIYVIFEQDVSEVGWFRRLFLRDTGFRDEDKFPERSIAYAWSLRSEVPDHFPNPFTERVMVFPLSYDRQDLGEWTTEHAHPFADYRKAFGKDPPDSFRLAIMCDADNTQSRAEGQVEFIEIRRESPIRDD